VSILIIDDSALHLRLIEDILQNAGFTDTIAIDSADGASVCVAGDSMRTDDQTLDLILMDLVMPDVNGHEACRLIKAKPHMADVPVIMVTARTDGESLRRAFAAGATDYIRKPIIAVELIARVSTALTMMSQRAGRKRRERELESALQELQALRSCLPVCISCKRIRSSTGGWTSLEEYVKTFSNFQINETICRPCIDQWNQAQEAA